MLAYEGLYLVDGEECEYLDVAFGVGVGCVEPELVELVWACLVGVEPDVAAFGLAEFTAVGFGDEGAYECVGFAVCGAADELGASGDVAPLVGAAELEFAAVVLVEVEEVVALHELVGELGEGHAFTAFGGQSFFDGVLGHHVVDGDVLAYVADEVDEGVVLHPVVVVDEESGVGCVGVEVEEAFELLLDGCYVVVECLLVEEVALGTLH